MESEFSVEEVKRLLKLILRVKNTIQEEKHLLRLATEWSSSVWHDAEMLQGVSLRAANHPATLFT